LLIPSLLSSTVALAAPGSLDPTFDGDGMVVTPVTSGFAFSVALQAGGKILVGGTISGDFALIRYHTNGALDTTFNGTGIATVDFAAAQDTAHSILVKGNEKIMLVGSAINANEDTALVQFQPNGNLDLGFSGDGKSSVSLSSNAEEPNGAAFQSDEKIVVSGTLFNGTINQMYLARFTSDGDLDAAGFGFLGVNIDPFTGDALGKAIAVMGDDRIVVAGTAIGTGGYYLAVARFTPNGTIDTTFGGGTGGATITAGPGDDSANAVAVQDDGKIVVAGDSKNGSGTDRITIGRFLTDGTADPAFGTGGVSITVVGPGHYRAYAVAVQEDGKILVFGNSSGGAERNFVLLRYLDNGHLDSGFGLNGVVKTSFGGGTHSGNALAVQSDGRIIGIGSLGSAQFGLALYKVAQGDLRVGRSAGVPVGDHRYNLSGVGQTQSRRIRSGRSIAHFYAVQNESSRPDRFLLKGSRGNHQISVIYRIGRGNQTAAINAGIYRTASLGAGRMQVIAASFRALGSRRYSKRFPITAKSLTDTAAPDRVVLHVTGGL